ncbi:MAG: S46 family peptidase [Holophagaceae bacterium]|nr:S46 family peptidase [Holophagaceae bacterium]
MRLTLTALMIAAIASPMLRPDEGMWTFNNIPVAKLIEKYGWAPDQAWLDHVRMSSLRFPGGSGSFVSKDGLVLTNHHVGHNFIQAVSKDADYVKDGFVAATREQEIKVPGLRLVMLNETINITDEVEKAVPEGANESVATAARQAAIASTLQAYGLKSGLQCEVITLFQGGEYWIYGYKTFQDVRLVACPEYQIAAFGKDDDNFTWPRHDLDFALFRVYEDDKPYQPQHHLKWSAEGTKNGGLTFVSGHPGSTSRLFTVAQMEYNRDVYYPQVLSMLETNVARLREIARSGPEGERQVSAQLMGMENSLKALTGYYKGLLDVEQMAKVRTTEEELIAKVKADPKLAALAGDSWDKIAKAVKDRDSFNKENQYINLGSAPTLFLAVNYIRSLKEAARPVEDRMQGYKSDSELAAIKDAFVKGPQEDPAKEVSPFAEYLASTQKELGEQHPFVATILEGKSAEDVAKQALGGTEFQNESTRNSLVDGGLVALSASKDPLVALACRIEPYMSNFRRLSLSVGSIISDNAARIAKARFDVYGHDVYPDATFSLRLSYGSVETFPMEGTLAQPFTTFYGMYDRAEAWGPEARWGSWSLPERWDNARGTINLKTPYNFITNNDITGGNSGSPLVDQKGELVGLAFDGNIHSLAGTYYFDPKMNRTIAVDSRSIIEALNNVMHGQHLVTEIFGK